MVKRCGFLFRRDASSSELEDANAQACRVCRVQETFSYSSISRKLYKPYIPYMAIPVLKKSVQN